MNELQNSPPSFVALCSQFGQLCVKEKHFSHTLQYCRLLYRWNVPVGNTDEQCELQLPTNGTDGDASSFPNVTVETIR